MGKKRCLRCSWNNKGQITIFMIIGLVVLVIFVLLIQFVSSFQKEQLRQAQEDVFAGVFGQEAMRIFVDSCLRNHLEEGLKLIGRQGRIWQDQEGGRQPFAEGITGLVDPATSERVYYGITQKQFSEGKENAYPCRNENNPPAYCSYEHPTLSGYGSLKLRGSGIIISDLKRYLGEKTVECVNNYIREEISSQAEIETSVINLNLRLNPQNIMLDVNYPLKFRLNNEEYFQLSKFDFTYPSKLSQLLDGVVAPTLEKETVFVDYNFLDELNDNEAYLSLDVEVEKSDIGGDDLFIFTLPAHTIIDNDQPYLYRIARQNRPPALDYVHRAECPAAEFDYLVVPGDDLYGDLDLNLNALDPDEDALTETNYFFEDVPEEWRSGTGPFNRPDFSLTSHFMETTPPGRYNLSARVKDEHGAEDWQKVRVLVDEPLTVSLSLDSPYQIYDYESGELKSYQTLFTQLNRGASMDSYFVSVEDPAFVKVELPETRLTAAPLNLILDYNNLELEEFSYDLADERILPQGEDCFSLPWLRAQCNLESYTKEDLLNWPSKLNSENDGYFSELTDSNLGIGRLKLSSSASYCQQDSETESPQEGTAAEPTVTEVDDTDEVRVIVKKCLPHRNPEHPFAFPYHNYLYSDYDFATKTGQFLRTQSNTELINPFQSTHSCCLGSAQSPVNWDVAAAGTVCFTDPTPGCYGRVEGHTVGHAGYVREERYDECDGVRGNVCGDGTGVGRYRLKDNELKCGNNADSTCRNINIKCVNQSAFSYFEDDGWCYGEMGCQLFCKDSDGKEIVYTGTERLSSEWAININQRALNNKATSSDTNKLPFKCGCATNGDDNNKPCDHNFDGVFDRVCERENCGIR